MNNDDLSKENINSTTEKNVAGVNTIPVDDKILQPNPKRDNVKTLGIFSIVFSFVIPPLGIILAIITIRRAQSQNRSKKLGITSLIIGIINTVIVIAILIVSLLIFNLIRIVIYEENNKINVAQIAAGPLTDKLKSSGAQLICEGGDSGLGLDNTTPWYSSYYRIDDKINIDEIIKGDIPGVNNNLNTESSIGPPVVYDKWTYSKVDYRAVIVTYSQGSIDLREGGCYFLEQGTVTASNDQKILHIYYNKTVN